MTDLELINSAISVSKNSYSPYSGFKVGAALLTDDGEVILGTNAENSAFPAGICAETAAIASAISKGKRDFSKIAIVGSKNGEITDFCYPCGICRQVLSEHCGDDFIIILFNGKEIKKLTLNELMPFKFGSEVL